MRLVRYLYQVIENNKIIETTRVRISFFTQRVFTSDLIFPIISLTQRMFSREQLYPVSFWTRFLSRRSIKFSEKFHSAILSY